MPEMPGAVCVIIAAWNAQATIARAVHSALQQSQVAEVMVVDDASSDRTAETAAGADDGSGRLHILRQARNAGPSAARNAAIAASGAPILTILDADDFYLPGRLAPLLAIAGWDAIADNIVFISEASADSFDPRAVAAFDPAPRTLSFAAFVEQNISRPNRPRAELGFVKPLIRRAFLEAHDLSYDETLRLGEDFALYARILAAGGRFDVVRHCGYVAVERAGSLSGSHSTADLEALLASDARLEALPGLGMADRAALRHHAAQLAANFRLRRFLDDKQQRGLGAALRHAAGDPRALAGTLRAILRDKTDWLRPAPPPRAAMRYLFS